MIFSYGNALPADFSSSHSYAFLPANRDISRASAFYATWLFDQGVPLSTIQSQLGHDRLETTAIYAHASGKRQAEDVVGLDF